MSDPKAVRPQEDWIWNEEPVYNVGEEEEQEREGEDAVEPKGFKLTCMPCKEEADRRNLTTTRSGRGARIA